jgi:hypothetical protein
MIYLGIYLSGVVIALAVMRDPWPVRVGTALVWPLGPIAFVVVTSILLVASVILWPLLLVPVLALLGGFGWWWLT